MSTSAKNRIRGLDATEFGDIQNTPDVMPGMKPRAYVRVEEEELSLPPAGLPPRWVAPLVKIMGGDWTVNNPAWSRNPVTRFRALQKKLVEHSLTLAESERSECLNAISLVERAVQLRLRWLQMERSHAESDLAPRGREESAAAREATADSTKQPIPQPPRAAGSAAESDTEVGRSGAHYNAEEEIQ